MTGKSGACLPGRRMGYGWGMLATHFSALSIMPKIISANLNGIRSAAKKGFFDWMAKQDADFICVQELKAQAPDMTPEMLNPDGYHGYFHYAEKKGYSGVGVYSKTVPDAVIIGFGSPEFDAEGRYVRCDFGTLSVISLYCPSGSSSPRAITIMKWERPSAIPMRFWDAPRWR